MNEFRSAALYGLVGTFPPLALALYIQFALPPDALHTANYAFLVFFPLALASLPWGFLIALANIFIGATDADTMLFVLIVISVGVNGIWISYTTKNQPHSRAVRLLLFSTIFSFPLLVFLSHA